MRILPLTAAASAAVLALVGAGTALPAAAAGRSPQTSASKLLAQALRAASAAGSVHFVDKSSVGSQSQQLVGAISAPTAGESLSGVAPLAVELVGGTIYVSGAASSLQRALPISATQAQQVGNKWIMVQSGDTPYQTLAQALSLSSALASFTPTGSTARLGKTAKVGGHKVIPIEGRPSSLTKGTSGSVALFVSAKAPHLPVGGTLVLANRTQRLNEAVAYTSWGAPVTLSAPTGAVAFSSITG